MPDELSVAGKWKEDMAKCKAWVDMILAMLAPLIKETNDVAMAIWFGVMEGKSARKKILALGGNPLPEIIAFEITLIGGPILKAYLVNLVKDTITQALKGGG